MKKRRKSNFNPWVSYSDIYSALLLTFVLISIFFLLKDMIELNTKAEELEKIAGIKKSIVEELINTFKNLQIEITIDNTTGSIVLSNDILFGFNDFQLTDKGKDIIKNAIPVYIDIILSSKNIDFISNIIIEGNTDPIGDYLYNMDLSLRRAYSVALYLKDIQNIIPNKNKFFKLLSCSGRGFSNPVLKKDKTIDYTKSRRVEIKFNIKDQEMIEKLFGILKTND